MNMALTTAAGYLLAYLGGKLVGKIGRRHKTLVFRPDPYGRFMHEGVRYGWVVAER